MYSSEPGNNKKLRIEESKKKSDEKIKKSGEGLALTIRKESRKETGQLLRFDKKWLRSTKRGIALGGERD